MKRANSLFDTIVSFDNLRLAYLKARRKKTSKKVVQNFARNVNANLETIRQRLIAVPPDLSPYTQFKIFDPKERTITVAPFPDRIIHHAIMNVLEPIFERQMIYHTYACRKGKGTHAAARYARTCCRKAQWFLKLDVRKYFDSVSHAVLKRQLTRIIKDGRTLSLLFTIIDGYHSPLSSASEGRGLPIGNLTSQFFANLYLSSLDHFVLEQLGLRGYVRYMDDFLLFGDSPQQLRAALSTIETFCREELSLALKLAVFGKTKDGVAFLGWLISTSHTTLTQKTRHRLKQTLHAINTDWELGRITDTQALIRTNATISCREIEST